MYRLLIVGDAPARAREWARYPAGSLHAEFQLLSAAVKAKPEQQTLIDVNLDDFAKLLTLKNWLSSKPEDARVVVAVDIRQRAFFRSSDDDASLRQRSASTR